MDWTQAIDNYCERIGSDFWGEPWNAVTNLAFLIAAALCWRLQRERRDAGAALLTVVLVAIGVGSFLFHTFATRWALLADVIPIQLFILIYLYLATRRFFALPWWAGAAAVVLFFPYAYATAAAIGRLTGPLNGSIGYVPVAILIALYGAALARRAPAVARGLFAGAGLLALSLFFRTVDAGVCGWLPVGTHFLWHTLNGIMLGWMIWLLHRHGPALAQAPAAR